MKENIGQLSSEQQAYEHRKMLHTLASGKSLRRRGVFNRIFELLGLRPYGNMPVETVKDPESKYDRCICFGYMHLGCMMNKKFKEAFDRYLVDYKTCPHRTRDTNGKMTNYGHLSLFFKWDSVQWGLMDSDLKEKYPNEFKVDKRGCVNLDGYKRKKIKFESIRHLVKNINEPIMRWEDLGTHDFVFEKETASSSEFQQGGFISFIMSDLKKLGIRHSDFEKMGIKLISSYPLNSNKYGRFEIKNLDKWKEAALQYKLNNQQ